MLQVEAAAELVGLVAGGQVFGGALVDRMEDELLDWGVVRPSAPRPRGWSRLKACGQQVPAPRAVGLTRDGQDCRSVPAVAAAVARSGGTADRVAWLSAAVATLPNQIPLDAATTGVLVRRRRRSTAARDGWWWTHRPPSRAPAPGRSGAGGPRQGSERRRARPFVAADLAAVLATCHRPRRVSRRGVLPGCRSSRGAAAPSAPPRSGTGSSV